MTPTCDYYHLDNEGRALPDRPAAWAYIGESGDYYVCDEHFQMRTDEGKRNWHRIDGPVCRIHRDERWIEIWHCRPPRRGVRYRVTREKWVEHGEGPDERHIYEWRVAS